MQNDSNEGQQLQNSDSPISPVAPVAQFSPEVTPFQKASRPKISKKTLVTILISVGSVILIAAGTLAYLLFVNNSSSSNSNTKAGRDLNTLGGSMKSSISDPVKVSSVVQKTNNTLATIKNVKDKIWVTVDDGSQVLNFRSDRNSPSTNEADYNSVIGALKAGGLSEIKTSTALSSIYSSSSEVAQFFSSEFITCNLDNSPISAVKDLLPTYSLQVNCANQADFNSNTDAIKPFFGSYTGTNDKDLVFRDPLVQDSGTPGYENAHLKVSDIDNNTSFVGLFYRKTDGDWKYFKTAEDQNKIECSEYNNEDLINSFIGFTCWDSSKKVSTFVSRPAQVVAPQPGDASSGSGG